MDGGGRGAVVAPRNRRTRLPAAAGTAAPTLQERTTGAAVFLEGLSMFKWELVHGEHGWFFRLRAQNGNIIATSEIYSGREAAEDTLRSLAGWFGECAVLWDVVVP